MAEGPASAPGTKLTPTQLRTFVLASLAHDADPRELSHRPGIEAQLQESWLSELIARSQALEHFPPYRLLTVRVMNPAAGAPGIVWFDRRVVYHPAEATLALASQDWINAYRRTHPLPVGQWSDDRLRGYIEELVKLRGLDFKGFKIRRLQRAPAPKDARGLTLSVAFERPWSPTPEALMATVVFLDDGGLSLFDVPL